MTLAELLPVPEADAPRDPAMGYGEVFTRSWVVELILDLVGYRCERDLAAEVLVEPSCGRGAFLAPIVRRLIESSRAHGHPLISLGSALRAFDLVPANAAHARREVVRQLNCAGLARAEAEALAQQWITTGDFLLQSHRAESADYVVGNPPYIRLENVPRSVMDDYRRICPAMRGRADVYVGFIERGLELLKPGATLSFICADRWMRNQYGATIRELIYRDYAVETVISLHGVDAFEDKVSAYPAIMVLRNRRQGPVNVVDANPTFGARDALRVSSWVRRRRSRRQRAEGYEASRLSGWFTGGDPWPTGSPSRLALIAELEDKFPPLEDPVTGTRVGIGVATGCDDVFITTDPELVEADRLLPLLQAPDTVSGTVDWSGAYLVDPWRGDRLVDLERYPRLAAYLNEHSDRLRARHVARRRPARWYRTIDRVDHDLTWRPKLVIPDLKASAHPVLDGGGYYPHHNLYYVVSESWKPEVLGGLLLSDVANLFVGAYCVRMRGDTYRFQAQYLRRIRVPPLGSLTSRDRTALADAFFQRDRERATKIAARLYGLDHGQLRTMTSS